MTRSADSRLISRDTAVGDECDEQEICVRETEERSARVCVRAWTRATDDVDGGNLSRDGTDNDGLAVAVWQYRSRERLGSPSTTRATLTQQFSGARTAAARAP